MASKYWCDACGREVGIGDVMTRCYGMDCKCLFKCLCGGCANEMDRAALAVFADIKRSGCRPERGLRAWLVQLFGLD